MIIQKISLWFATSPFRVEAIPGFYPLERSRPEPDVD
jgi:hypothetical protein